MPFWKIKSSNPFEEAQFKKTDFGHEAQSRLSNVVAANQCPETTILVMVSSGVEEITEYNGFELSLPND